MDAAVLRSQMIASHKNIIQQLELKYIDYINKLLHQKSSIIIKLQQSFYNELNKLNLIVTSKENSKNISDDVIQSFNNAVTNNMDNISDGVESYHIIPILSTDNIDDSDKSDDQNELIESKPSNIDIQSNNSNKHSNKHKKTNAKTNKNKSWISSKKQNGMQRNNDKEHKCSFCKYQTDLRSNLTTHIRTHRPFQCHYCIKAFGKESNLKTHIRIHTGEKPFKCGYCSKAFNQKGNLKTHIRVHTGEKSFKCNMCDRAFIQKHHLNSHIRIHTGEKPFKCGICQKRFRHSSNFYKHKKTHLIIQPNGN